MALRDRFQKQLTLWQLVVGLSVTILGGAATAGATFSTVYMRLEAIEQKQASATNPEKRLGKIERNIVRIGSKLGVQLENPD